MNQLERLKAELTTVRSSLASERQERIEWQACAKAMERSFTTARAELATVRAENAVMKQEQRDLHGGIVVLNQTAQLSELRAELQTTRAALSTLEQAAREAVAMYDRYCLHDMTIDEHDLGKTLEGVRLALERALNEVSK